MLTRKSTLCLSTDQLDAAVLRQSLLGDIDAGHDLQSADHRAPHAQLDLVALDALSVDAVAHPHAVLHRLDVDIARPASDGFGDHPLHELDDRGLGGVVRAVLAQPIHVDRLAEVSTDLSTERSTDLSTERSTDRSTVRSIVRSSGLVDRVVGLELEHVVDHALDPARAAPAPA